jgi:hypothetical protein
MPQKKPIPISPVLDVVGDFAGHPSAHALLTVQDHDHRCPSFFNPWSSRFKLRAWDSMVAGEVWGQQHPGVRQDGRAPLHGGGRRQRSGHVHHRFSELGAGSGQPVYVLPHKIGWQFNILSKQTTHLMPLVGFFQDLSKWCSASNPVKKQCTFELTAATKLRVFVRRRTRSSGTGAPRGQGKIGDHEAVRWDRHVIVYSKFFHVSAFYAICYCAFANGEIVDCYLFGVRNWETLLWRHQFRPPLLPSMKKVA